MRILDDAKAHVKIEGGYHLRRSIPQKTGWDEPGVKNCSTPATCLTSRKVRKTELCATIPLEHRVDDLGQLCGVAFVDAAAGINPK